MNPVMLDQITIGELKILVLDMAPTIGVGFSAPLGSLVIVQGQAGIYQKTSANDTDWTTSSVNAEDVLDIIGAALSSSSTIALSYDDLAGTVSAGIVANSIDNSHISATAAIDATKIADGSVSNTEFQHLSNVSSDIQGQLDALAAEDLTFLKLDGTRPMTGSLNMGGQNIDSVGVVTASSQVTIQNGDTFSSMVPTEISVSDDASAFYSYLGTNYLTFDQDSIIGATAGNLNLSADAAYIELQSQGQNVLEITPTAVNALKPLNMNNNGINYVADGVVATDAATKGQLDTLATYANSTFIPLSQKGAANGVATLGADSKIPTSQLPALAITDVHVVANIAARDALTVEEGDVAKVTDAGAGLPRTYIYDGAAWVEIESGSDVDTVNGYTGTVILDTDDIAEGSSNLYFTNARAKTAAVSNAIVDGVLDVAPSQNAVYDALALLDAEDLTFLKLDGSRSMSGTLNLADNQLTFGGGTYARYANPNKFQYYAAQEIDIGQYSASTQSYLYTDSFGAYLAHTNLTSGIGSSIDVEQSLLTLRSRTVKLSSPSSDWKVEHIWDTLGHHYVQYTGFEWIDVGTSTIRNLVAGVNSSDAVNKGQLDAVQSALDAEDLTFLKLNGSRSMSGDLNMGSNDVVNVGAVGIGTVTPETALEIVDNNVKFNVKGASTTTSGAVNAVISSITPANNSVEVLKVFITGIDTTSHDSVAYEKTVKVKNVGNTVSLSTIQSDYTAEDPSLSAANSTFIVNANSIDIRVTGVNNKNITWKCLIHRMR